MKQKSTRSLVLGTLTFVLFALPVTAGEVPFVGRFSGVNTISHNPDGSFSVYATATGIARHLGRCTIEMRGDVELNGSIPVPIPATSSATLTAANGDRLFGRFRWSATPLAIPGQFESSGTFEVTGGSGRFAGASGHGDWQGAFDAFGGSVSGSLEGFITDPGAN